jgi:hypothetical protein
MDRQLLKVIAEAILTELIGPGNWYKDNQLPRFEAIDNPLMGIEVGDVVFTYDTDNEELKEGQIIAMVDGIGYVLRNSKYYGPSLLAVSDDDYGRTAKEAAEVNREQIERDIKWARERYDRTTKIKQILGQ